MPVLFTKDQSSFVTPMLQSKQKWRQFAPDQMQVDQSVYPSQRLQWPQRNTGDSTFIPESRFGPGFGSPRNPFRFTGSDSTADVQFDLMNAGLNVRSKDGNTFFNISPQGGSLNFPVGEKGAARFGADFVDPGAQFTFTTNASRTPQPYYNPVDSLFSNQTSPNAALFGMGVLPGSDVFLKPNAIDDSLMGMPSTVDINTNQNGQQFASDYLKELIGDRKVNPWDEI